MYVVHHPDQALHDPDKVFRYGHFIAQPDRAERYRIFLRAALDGGHQVTEAPECGLDPILAVHEADYVTFLQTAWQRWSQLPAASQDAIPSVHPTHRMHRKPTDILGELGWYSNSTSCPIQKDSWASVYASACSAVAAARYVAESGHAAYALCRPPGHHSYPDLMTGVCYLNNAAIGTEILARRYGKIAIIDIDVHHGNGTQFIFWRRPDVLFCSIHADPNRTAPYYAGYADEIGEGPGKGLNINMPLPFGTDDATFLIHVDRAIRAAADFGAAAIVVSLGFDASEHDPHQTFKISNEGFAETARRIAGLGRPTLLVQEGGYLNPHLGTTLSGFLHAFDSVGKELA